MANASIELQKSILNKLDEGVYKVVDIKPKVLPFPFIEIGEEIQRDSDDKTNFRTVHNVTIHTWSKGNSSIQSKEMNQFVKESILKLDTVNGFEIDIVTLEMMMTLKEQETDSTIFHGVIQIEITLTGDDR